MSLCCSPASNKIAGNLDMEYPWPLTQRWPEEVMSGENVPGATGQADSQVRQCVPPWDFLSRLSLTVCLSKWLKLAQLTFKLNLCLDLKTCVVIIIGHQWPLEQTDRTSCFSIATRKTHVHDSVYVQNRMFQHLAAFPLIVALRDDEIQRLDPEVLGFV